MISMEEIMQTRVKLLCTTALAAAGLVLGASAASADEALEKRVKALEKSGGMYVTRSKKTMKLVVNGHMNRAIMVSDNGTTSGISHVTNSFSQTRVRWIGTGKVNADLTAMTYIEVGHSTQNSSGQNLGSDGDDANAVFANRFAELRLSSKSMGTIYLGQGATATDGVSEADLSGTGIISLNGAGNLIGGGETWQSNGAGAGLGTVADKFNSLDGNGRQGRLRWDTPKFSGMNVSIDHGNNDEWGVALRYGAKIGGMSVKAAIAHTDQTVNGGIDILHGSASILFPMGLSLTVGAAEQDDEDGGANDTEEWRYAKVGYKFKGSSMGQTRLFADFSQNEDRATAGETSEYFGMGIVQIVEPLGMEVYGLYRNFSLDSAAGADPDDISVLVGGVRVSF
jgi:hypothetical protein